METVPLDHFSMQLVRGRTGSHDGLIGSPCTQVEPAEFRLCPTSKTRLDLRDPCFD